MSLRDGSSPTVAMSAEYFRSGVSVTPFGPLDVVI